MNRYFDDSGEVGADEEDDGDEELGEEEEKWGGCDVEHPLVTTAPEEQRRVRLACAYDRRGKTVRHHHLEKTKQGRHEYLPRVREEANLPLMQRLGRMTRCQPAMRGKSKRRKRQK